MTPLKPQMNIITSPEPTLAAGVSIFLAGSIEQDKAVDWQKQAAASFANMPVTLFNPRRKEWDASWTEDDPRFIEQVEWELDALDKASLIMMHFEPGTMSPITLLELGLYAKSRKLYVSCPPGFWRRGNVKIVCARHGVQVHESLDDLLVAVKSSAQIMIDHNFDLSQFT